MDATNELLQFNLLKDQVLSMAGMKHMTAADCKALSVLLFKRTNKHLSETTLTRIYGFAEARFAPSAFTKDVLASFCGYQSWQHYTLDFLTRDHLANLNPFHQTMVRQQANNGIKDFLDSLKLRIFLLSAVHDPDGAIIDFRIEAANEAMAAATGRKDLTGKLYSQEYPGIKKSGHFDQLRKVMETGQSERSEYDYPYDGLNTRFTSQLVKTQDGLWTAYDELPDSADVDSASPEVAARYSETVS